MNKDLIFSFEDLSLKDKAAKKAAQYFSRAGSNVIQSSVGPMKRTAGVSFKSLNLTFADGQIAELRIKSTGDVYQALINGKVVPIKDQMDHAKAISELAKVLDNGRAAFQKKQSLVKVELPKGIKSAAPKMADALKNRVTELDNQISEAKAKVEELKAELGGAAMDSIEGDGFAGGIPNGDGVALDGIPIAKDGQFMGEKKSGYKVERRVFKTAIAAREFAGPNGVWKAGKGGGWKQVDPQEIEALDSVNYSVKTKFVESEPHKRSLGAKQVAWVEWQGSGRGGVALVNADDFDYKEFGYGTFRVGKGEMAGGELIVKIDPKGMKLYFVDDEHYRETDEVKWQTPVKLTNFVINDKAKFESAFRGSVLDGVDDANEEDEAAVSEDQGGLFDEFKDEKKAA